MSGFYDIIGEIHSDLTAEAEKQKAQMIQAIKQMIRTVIIYDNISILDELYVDAEVVVYKQTKDAVEAIGWKIKTITGYSGKWHLVPSEEVKKKLKAEIKNFRSEFFGQE